MKRIYTCITESLCCKAEIKHNSVNQLYFNNIFKQQLGITDSWKDKGSLWYTLV